MYTISLAMLPYLIRIYLLHINDTFDLSLQHFKNLSILFDCSWRTQIFKLYTIRYILCSCSCTCHNIYIFYNEANKITFIHYARRTFFFSFLITPYSLRNNIDVITVFRNILLSTKKSYIF